jgi:hypothetical protein
MSPSSSARIVRAIGLAVVIGLPLLGTWLRRQSDGGCALDGVRVDPRYAVRIVDAQGEQHPFCCLQCAVLRQQRQDVKPRQVLVTDEASGQLFEGASAYFVRSGVVTNAITGNRVHVFRNRQDAMRHVELSRGLILSGNARPFPALNVTEE